MHGHHASLRFSGSVKRELGIREDASGGLGWWWSSWEIFRKFCFLLLCLSDCWLAPEFYIVGNDNWCGGQGFAWSATCANNCPTSMDAAHFMRRISFWGRWWSLSSRALSVEDRQETLWEWRDEKQLRGEEFVTCQKVTKRKMWLRKRGNWGMKAVYVEKWNE